MEFRERHWDQDQSQWSFEKYDTAHCANSRFSTHFINFMLFFWEYCWFWFASDRADWDVTLQSFDLSYKYLMSRACECNFSRRVSKSRLNPSASSLVLKSKSLYCFSIFKLCLDYAVTEFFRSFFISELISSFKSCFRA